MYLYNNQHLITEQGTKKDRQMRSATDLRSRRTSSYMLFSQYHEWRHMNDVITSALAMTWLLNMSRPRPACMPNAWHCWSRQTRRNGWWNISHFLLVDSMQLWPAPHRVLLCTGRRTRTISNLFSIRIGRTWKITHDIKGGNIIIAPSVFYRQLIYFPKLPQQLRSAAGTSAAGGSGEGGVGVLLGLSQLGRAAGKQQLWMNSFPAALLSCYYF